MARGNALRRYRTVQYNMGLAPEEVTDEIPYNMGLAPEPRPEMLDVEARAPRAEPIVPIATELPRLRPTFMTGVRQGLGIPETGPVARFAHGLGQSMGLVSAAEPAPGPLPAAVPVSPEREAEQAAKPEPPAPIGDPDALRHQAVLDTQKEIAASFPRPAAKPAPSPTRAIRLPNGRIMFTNLSGNAGGEEISTREGGRAVREQTISQPGLREAVAERRLDETSLPEKIQGRPIDPTSGTMSALVRASSRAALARGEGGPGEASPAPSGISTIAGTHVLPSQLEDVVNNIALASAGQEFELASKPASEALMAQNKDVQAMRGMVSVFAPLLSNANRQAQVSEAKAQAVLAAQPGDPIYIEDPKLRAAKVSQYRNEADEATKTILALAANAMRQRANP